MVVHPVNHFQQDLRLLIESLFCLIYEDGGFEIERLDEFKQSVYRLRNDYGRQPEPVAKLLGGDGLARTLQSVEDDTKVLARLLEHVRVPCMDYMVVDGFPFSSIYLEIDDERFRNLFETDAARPGVDVNPEYAVPRSGKQCRGTRNREKYATFVYPLLPVEIIVRAWASIFWRILSVKDIELQIRHRSVISASRLLLNVAELESSRQGHLS